MPVQATFEAIRALLNPEKVQACSGGLLSIEEKDRGASLRAVHIADVGQIAFALKYDQCGFPGQTTFTSPLGKSLHRACDSIAFCEVDNEPYVLCCELKSSEPSRHEVSEQFRNAQCFLIYLDTLLKQYCNGLSIADWKHRYFVFHNQTATPLTQSPSRADFNSNTSPERARFIPVQNSQRQYSRQLLGKPL